MKNIENQKGIIVFILLSTIILITSFVFINRNSADVLNSIKSNLTFSLSTTSSIQKLNHILNNIEKNTEIIEDTALDSFPLEIINNKQQLKDFLSFYDNLIINVVVFTDSATGAWIQLNPEITSGDPSFYNGYHYKDGKLMKREKLYRQLNEEKDSQYFAPLKTPEKKAVWTDVYVDWYTHEPQITFSAPMFKDKILIGVTGMNVSFKDINTILESIHSVYEGSELYLINKDFKVVSSFPYKKNIVNQNLFDHNQNIKFLKENIKNKLNLGSIDYKNGFDEKILVFTHLSNGYYLIMTVPTSTVYKNFNAHIFLSYILFFVLAGVTFYALYGKHRLQKDITKRKLLEDSLISKKNQIKAILDNITDGIITVNESGIVESVNPAIENMFGYTKNEIIGEHIKILFPHEPCEYFNPKTKTCLASETCFIKKKIINSMDYVATTKNGKSFYIETGLSQYTIEGKVKYLLMVHNITQRKKMENIKNEFISTVNHELRTPLTSIQGSLGLILSDAFGAIPDKAQELLNIANKNCSRLVHLINDILDIEKIEAGKMVFDKKIYEILPIIHQAIDENKSFAEKYKVFFKIDKSIDNAKVLVDKNRLIQVITNLLSNAAKFSPEGCEVKIIISKTDKNVRVSIEDKGPGIPEEFKDHIFTKFSQVDSSDSRSKGGTGLGLSICKSIIEKLGGEIGLETKTGKGTTFYFSLPLVQ